MPVPALITDLSTTAISNSPQGTDTAKGSIDDHFRAHASFIAQQRDKLSTLVSVKDAAFGAVGDGVTDDTVAFNLVKAYLTALGGGKALLPAGSYKLTNFDLDQQNIVFEGATSGYAYATSANGVRIIPSGTAVYAARLKGVNSLISYGSACAGSGFRNIQFLGTSEYGMFIDGDNTLVEKCTFQGFQYGCVMAASINSNKFINCGFILNTKVGFATTELAAAGYCHPNISSVTPVSNTKFSMIGCNFRQNGFGMILRSAINSSFQDCVFESNDHAGSYIYRPDSATVRNLKFKNCWWENNYQTYTSGSVAFSITNNNMLKITNTATYIAWTSLLQAGYQLLIDSQTRAGGGGDNIEFDQCDFNCANTQQKAIKILAGFKTTFYRPHFASGDPTNLISCTTDAEATHFYDAFADNNPYTPVPCLVSTFGTNTGTRGVVSNASTSLNAGQLAAHYPLVGATGGPVHFLAPVASDPRNTDPRMLDDYYENDSFTIPWRVGGALPFTVNTQVNSITKIGRKVHIECRGTLTASATTAAADTFFCNASLPYQAAASGNVVGQVVIKATGGGATVVNNGISPMEMNAIASTISVLNVFPILAIGNTFSFQVQIDYVSAT